MAVDLRMQGKRNRKGVVPVTIALARRYTKRFYKHPGNRCIISCCDRRSCKNFVHFLDPHARHARISKKEFCVFSNGYDDPECLKTLDSSTAPRDRNFPYDPGHCDTHLERDTYLHKRSGRDSQWRSVRLSNARADCTAPALQISTFCFYSHVYRGLTCHCQYSTPPIPTIAPPSIFQTTATGIPTNFAAGDVILFSGFNPTQFPSPGNASPLTLSFATPVVAAGTQIAVDDTSEFTALMTAFDSNNNLLRRFSALGSSSLALDNSAVFLGVQSQRANIARLEFSSSVLNRAIHINRLSLQAAAVPEPSGMIAS